MRLSPFATPAARIAAGTMGMRLFLLSLGILFAASLIGYVSIRMTALGKAVDIPPLPRALWASTALLLVSSATVQAAVNAARAERWDRLRRAVTATTVLGFAFLAVQTACWIDWAGPMRETLAGSERRFLLTAFYVLTGLHAAHVVGGLVPLSVITSRAWRGRYPDGGGHAGVLYAALYWHFLDGVWIVLFATLLVGS